MCLKIANSSNTTVAGFNTNCDRVYYNSTDTAYHCGKCIDATKVVLNNTCTVDAAFAPNCYVKTTTPATKCKVCKDGFYMSSPNSDKCCALN